MQHLRYREGTAEIARPNTREEGASWWLMPQEENRRAFPLPIRTSSSIRLHDQSFFENPKHTLDECSPGSIPINSKRRTLDSMDPPSDPTSHSANAGRGNGTIQVKQLLDMVLDQSPTDSVTNKAIVRNGIKNFPADQKDQLYAGIEKQKPKFRALIRANKARSFNSTRTAKRDRYIEYLDEQWDGRRNWSRPDLLRVPLGDKPSDNTIRPLKILTDLALEHDIPLQTLWQRGGALFDTICTGKRILSKEAAAAALDLFRKRMTALPGDVSEPGSTAPLPYNLGPDFADAPESFSTPHRENGSPVPSLEPEQGRSQKPETDTTGTPVRRDIRYHSPSSLGTLELEDTVDVVHTPLANSPVIDLTVDHTSPEDKEQDAETLAKHNKAVWDAIRTQLRDPEASLTDEVLAFCLKVVRQTSDAPEATVMDPLWLNLQDDHIPPIVHASPDVPLTLEGSFGTPSPKSSAASSSASTNKLADIDFKQTKTTRAAKDLTKSDSIDASGFRSPSNTDFYQCVWQDTGSPNSRQTTPEQNIHVNDTLLQPNTTDHKLTSTQLFAQMDRWSRSNDGIDLSTAIAETEQLLHKRQNQADKAVKRRRLFETLGPVSEALQQANQATEEIGLIPFGEEGSIWSSKLEEDSWMLQLQAMSNLAKVQSQRFSVDTSEPEDMQNEITSIEAELRKMKEQNKKAKAARLMQEALKVMHEPKFRDQIVDYCVYVVSSKRLKSHGTVSICILFAHPQKR
ncbi:hypothetical protein NW752_001372 [Fusarium irregulare]|nr:hypothetical protein NW752_001372 [Fusarium irregulare]